MKIQPTSKGLGLINSHSFTNISKSINVLVMEAIKWKWNENNQFLFVLHAIN